MGGGAGGVPRQGNRARKHEAQRAVHEGRGSRECTTAAGPRGSGGGVGPEERGGALAREPPGDRSGRAELVRPAPLALLVNAVVSAV